MKIRSRKFDGRCGRHKHYSPAVDGQEGIKSGCPRCRLLFDIWEASLKLNQLIRGFNPRHDDSRTPVKAEPIPEADPRQMRLL